MNAADISGMVFTVTPGNGNGGGGTKFQMSEDEWYPAVLTKIEKYEAQNQQFGPQLNWTFELQGENFSYEYEGKKQQSSIRGSTSMIFSSNPKRPSKLFTWYCKLTGKIPTDGEKVTIGALIGMRVEVMVKSSPGKDKNGNATTWYNVEKVKPSNVGVTHTSTPTPPQQPTNKNPGGVTDPSQIPDTAVGTPKATPAPVSTKAEGDLYKDVF